MAFGLKYFKMLRGRLCNAEGIAIFSGTNLQYKMEAV